MIRSSLLRILLLRILALAVLGLLANVDEQAAEVKRLTLIGSGPIGGQPEQRSEDCKAKGRGKAVQKKALRPGRVIFPKSRISRPFCARRRLRTSKFQQGHSAWFRTLGPSHTVMFRSLRERRRLKPAERAWPSHSPS